MKFTRFAFLFCCVLILAASHLTAANAQCAAIVYEHADFNGQSMCLYPGMYDVDAFHSGIGNDQLSSIELAPGYRAIMYEHHQFSGNSMRVNGSVSYVGDRWNDKVSSIVVERK